MNVNTFVELLLSSKQHGSLIDRKLFNDWIKSIKVK